MTYIGGEATSVQKPLIRYAIEAGWTYLSPEDAMLHRNGEDHSLLLEIFKEQAQKLNPGIINAARAHDLAQRLELVSPRIEGNLDAWEYLRGLKTVFVPEQKRELNIKLLDPHNWQANTFHVTEELRYYNHTYRIRLDAAFFVNGIPVLFVETKSATKLEGIADAIEQVRRYHREGPELMALLQFYNVTHLIQYYYGPTWNVTRKNLYNWRDEQSAPDFETLVKTFVAPQRISRMLHDFILFTRQDDVLNKVILRPHQMRAVERVIRRSADLEKKRGLVWHTQGSGKTFTMITAAKKIMEEKKFKNPTILMLVDRNELETQLFGVLQSAGVPYEEAYSKKRLYTLLRNDQRGVIVSMIHKFEKMPENVNLHENIIVLVDEAHRTTNGDLGNYLMGALPNATYIGFTGTPIDKTAKGQGTFKIFGVDDHPKGYLDKYSIAESINDGTTVQLNYTLAPNDLRVDRETLEKEFLQLKEAEGVNDIEELNRILEKAVTLRNMLKNPERMKLISEAVARHFSETVEPLGYKAFLVAVDRDACATYKKLLDQHLPTEYSNVVYSSAHNDSENLKEYYLTTDQEKQIRKDFRDPQKQPKILIVTEKLLTGFDAPILYCMYLDKPMRDHVLLQAIARVNRPYEDEQGRAKPCGFVMDFVGIFEKLEKALAFDSKDVSSTIADLDKLKSRFYVLMETGKNQYLSIITGSTPDKKTESIINYFLEVEVRQEFYRFYKELETLYEIISPDKDLRPYLNDFLQLSRMYALLRAAFDKVSIDHELARKTALLVQTHTSTSEIQTGFEIYEINDTLLAKINGQEIPDTVKIFNLLKSIEHLVEVSLMQAPYLYSIGERAEAIAQAFQQRQVDTKDALKQLEEIINEINQAEKDRAERSLSPAGFSVYYLLHKANVATAETTARNIEKVFNEFPHFMTSLKQEQEVRARLYKYLLPASDVKPDIGSMKELVDQMIKIVGRLQA